MLRWLVLQLSSNRRLRAFAEHSSLGQRISGRFVAGITPMEALATVQRVNQRGFSASIDSLGENVSSATEARASAEVYHRLLGEIAARGLNANVSLKLTQMGLDIDEGLARELVTKIVAKAALCGSFVRVDMEGSAYTEKTLEIVRDIHALHPGHIGAVIQAYLRRSREDVERLLGEGIRIRLCKGAYQEPPDIAFESKSQVEASFVDLMKRLLKSGVYHGIATHDPRMITETQRFSRSEGISPNSFEFQMLYGIRRDLQEKILREGWRMRVYIPFGPAWYPYLMRRIAERPANLAFVLRNLLRG
ncbi:MAG: proline dehydrogenase family protein [Candidatus Korobacteraceae bacterium]